MSTTTDKMPDLWRQGALLEVTITSLNHNGEGVGRWEGRVVFVPDAAPGDRLLARLVRVKPTYAHAKLHEILEPSPHRIRPACIVADKCGGCQWQHIDYRQQLEAKRQLVVQDLERIGGFAQPPVDPVMAAASPLAYRNKATYPLGLSPARKMQAGYYQKGSHQLINLNQCPIQDERLNPLLAEVKVDMQRRGWQIYDETTHQGQLRHLGLRIGRNTGDLLITLVSTSDHLPKLTEQANQWIDRYPKLKGVLLNINPHRTNAIFGAETHCIAGQPTLRERFLGLQFDIGATTFFQVHTEQAEALLQVAIAHLNLQGTEHLVDGYCGIGTLSLPLAQQVGQVTGIETHPDSVTQASQNAALNGITNARFIAGAVEAVLPTLEGHLDIVVLDPPRKGCDAHVLEMLLALKPQQIAYMSCNPSTLARDLKQLCQAGGYRLTRVQPADFFPQTAHVECVAFLVA